MLDETLPVLRIGGVQQRPGTFLAGKEEDKPYARLRRKEAHALAVGYRKPIQE
jgi:hypothetical protein